MTTRRLTYCGNVHAAETFETWIESVEAFSRGASQADDMTLVSISWEGGR